MMAEQANFMPNHAVPNSSEILRILPEFSTA
jgi:hypothetical protein